MMTENQSEEKNQEFEIEYDNNVSCESLPDEDNAVTVDVNHFTTTKRVPVCYTVYSVIIHYNNVHCTMYIVQDGIQS